MTQTIHGIRLKNLSECAQANLKKVKKLTEKNLQKKYKLPCECEKLEMAKLLSPYLCSKCEEEYYFCFCSDEVMDTWTMWYCEDCGECHDDGIWKCHNCGECTYGVTLECEYCGEPSPCNI